MTDINSITIIGRLTKEPKLDTVGNSSKCTISIANNRSFKKGDAWETQVSYFEVVVWGPSGERLSSKLVKGDQVAVTGRLTQDRWEKDGQKQSRIYINAESVQPCTPSGASVSTPAESNPVSAVAQAFNGTVTQNEPFDLF